jgi:predicted RNA-binding protein with PIN domain
MHYYIDGYNLLFRVTEGKKSLQQKREAILELLGHQITDLNLHLTVVFDSKQHHTRGHLADLEIVYAAENQSADAYIIQEIERSSDPGQETVVTSDRELAQSCKLLGARTQSIDAFLASLLKKRKKKKRPTAHPFRDSDAQIARLLEIFEKRLENE